MTTASFSSQPSATCKALIYNHIHKTLSLSPEHPIPIPDPTKTDHLIKVKTTALCARELKWVEDFPDAIFSENPSKEITPGYDLAGIVLTTPPGSPFKIGDEILARTRPNRPGNCREYTIARTYEMALKPQKLSWVESATVPLSALAAWQALFQHAGVNGLHDPESAGKKVLVTAAAGGVGVWLVQLARIAGLDVVAQIGNAKNDKFVRDQGASRTINYRQESLRQWAEREGPADIVLDNVGGETLEDAWFAVKNGGALISIVEVPELRKPKALPQKDVRSEFFIMDPDGQQLTEITKLLDEGKCRPVVDSEWKLEDYDEAFERLDGGHANGKVVIKVAD